jgi:hypothetical protein
MKFFFFLVFSVGREDDWCDAMRRSVAHGCRYGFTARDYYSNKSLEIFLVLDTTTFSFLFNKYCLIIN